MLAGEYDYACAVEPSAATAAKILRLRFQPVPSIGHFPSADNPALFTEYMLPILAKLSAG